MPNFNNDVVKQSSIALFEYCQGVIGESNHGTGPSLEDLKTYKNASTKYPPEEIEPFLKNANKMYEENQEEDLLLMINIYCISNDKFDIDEPLKGSDRDMWRNMMENSYNSSLTEKEKLDSDKESDFKKSFKEVFSRQFRESFSQYIKDKESELGVLEDHKEMLVEEVVEDFKEVRGEKRSAEEDIEESPSKRARGKGEASEAFVVESSSPLPSGRREISASPQRPPMNSPSRVPLRPPGSQEGLPTGVRLSSARLIDGIQSPRSAGNTI